MKIGVIGHGFVGRAVSSFYQTNLIYDKFKPSLSLKKVVEAAEVIFVCVPTNGTREGYDYQPLKETIQLLSVNGYRFPIIIKSTTQPGEIDLLQRNYPKLRLFFNPEFLDQVTAKKDFAHPQNPPCQILGLPQGKSVSQKGWVHKLFDPFKVPLIITSAVTAETLKLATNALYTTRVVFSNQIFDYCQSVGADYEIMASLWQQIPRLGTHGYQIVHNGGRGAGGYCLPKDIHALLTNAAELGLQLPLLKSVEKINNLLLSKSGKRIKEQPKTTK